MLVTIDDVLTSQELAAARELLAFARWESGLATAGPQAARVKNNNQLPEDCAQLPALRALVLDALHRQPVFLAAALPLKVLPPFFNRYAGGQNAYGPHVDNAMMQVPARPGVYLRADVSATLFLTDPDDYDGGELTVEDTFGSHRVKLRAGSVVIYPSSSMHEVTPVTRGARVSCFMFIESMVRDPGQRRLLYDMDMALLQLRDELGETAPVVQLTATYHNLLRRWAQG